MITNLVEGLNAERKGNEYVALCPCHQENTPSFYFKQTESGKILFHCFAGCSQESIILELKKRKLYNSELTLKRDLLPVGISYFWPPTAILKKQNKEITSDTQKTFSDIYIYYAKTGGKILGYVVRYEGHGKKDLIPYFIYRDNKYWSSGLGSFNKNRTLYNIDLLNSETTYIYFVEGEKCAKRLQKYFNDTNQNDKIALTWLGGTSSVSKSDYSDIKGYKVYLWPDNDKVGHKAMDKLCSIIAQENEVQFVDTSVFVNNGYDCYDFLKDGYGLKDLNFISKKIDIKKNEKTVEIKLNHHLTDLGNARRLIDNNKDNIKYCNKVDWFYFNSEIWKQDEQSYILKLATETAEKITEEITENSDQDEIEMILKHSRSSQQLSKLKAMIEVAKSIENVTIQPTKFDQDNFLFCVKNGILDLKENKLIEFNKEQYISKQSLVKYDKNAKCDNWIKFLNKIFDNNQEIINYLKRAVGYSLTGSTEEQIMLLLWGSGSNGKSVFCETLKLLHGDYAVSTNIDMLLIDSKGKADTSTNSLARLKGQRLVLGSEIPQNAKFNESRIKEITGQDTISARFLFKEFFDFIPNFKLFIRSNYRPEITGEDLGIWRRIHCVPFNINITETEKDKNLLNKLKLELSGILNWALEGVQDWLIQGLNAPSIITQSVQNYKDEMDIVGQWIDDCCEIDSKSKISSKLLLKNFNDWAISQGERHRSMRYLKPALENRGFYRQSTIGGKFYVGLRLKEEINYIQDEYMI